MLNLRRVQQFVAKTKKRVNVKEKGDDLMKALFSPMNETKIVNQKRIVSGKVIPKTKGRVKK